MVFFTAEQCAEWCTAKELPLPSSEQSLASSLASTHVQYNFSIPQDAGRRIALCRHLWNEAVPDRSDAQQGLWADEVQHRPHGRLLWLDEWDVWPSAQHLPLFMRLRASFGETRPLIAAPGQLVGDHEDDDGLSFLVVAALFLFDCWLYVNSGLIIVLYHDEVGSAYVPLGTAASSIPEILARHGVLG